MGKMTSTSEGSAIRAIVRLAVGLLLTIGAAELFLNSAGVSSLFKLTSLCIAIAGVVIVGWRSSAARVNLATNIGFAVVSAACLSFLATRYEGLLKTGWPPAMEDLLLFFAKWASISFVAATVVTAVTTIARRSRA
jgi:hypothetical protein